MKIVTFEVAKALKEAGYPQEWNDTEFYYTESGELKRGDDYEGNSIEDIMYYQRYAVTAPYCVEVWLWLWREKKIAIGCPYENTYNYWFANMYAENDESLKFWKYSSEECNDPEEAIIAAIQYIVEQQLL